MIGTNHDILSRRTIPPPSESIREQQNTTNCVCVCVFLVYCVFLFLLFFVIKMCIIDCTIVPLDQFATCVTAAGGTIVQITRKGISMSWWNILSSHRFRTATKQTTFICRLVGSPNQTGSLSFLHVLSFCWSILASQN